jgi:quercetin dioxygenase-like cupin family protein
MTAEETVAGPVNPADLVQYQDGTIVSRTIADRPTGTITLFAFAAGQALSEHTAPFDAMLMVLDGKAEVTISGKADQLSAGQMIVMPANQPHAVAAVANFKMLLVMIRS